MVTKTGLALSGGGFRAAFYHVGVLARLADEDRLRSVEVISAVSGGSIVAALYGLHLRSVLESKPDKEITRADYQDVVWKVGHSLRRGVRRNLRMRIFANPFASLMMLRPDYTRSDRMAQLYERHLYRGLGSNNPVRMEDLLVHPPGAPKFDPEKHNANRTAKVPITLLNATVLNTGHNWRFEGTRMGEPPIVSQRGQIIQRVDKNMRLERADSYAKLPARPRPNYPEFPLKYAVAASTAVPGIFAPLSLSGLYPKLRVQLVDGGVHDNQGLQGLLDHDCTHFLVSDASGRLEDKSHPASNILGVLPRSNSVMADRMREEQLVDLLEHHAPDDNLASLLEDVTPPFVPYIGSDTPAVPRSDPDQRALAGIRTDLDAFHDVEAYALARNGYQAMGTTPGMPADHAAWPFLRVGEVPEKKRMRLLRLGASKIAKPFRVNDGMKVLGIALILLAIAGGVAAGSAIGWRNIFGLPGLAAAGAVLLYALLVVLVQQYVPNHGLGAWVRGIVRGIPGVPLAIVGMILSNGYLWFLNGIYLRAGAVPGGEWSESINAVASSTEAHASPATASS